MAHRTRPANMFLRFGKLKGPTAALRAARHNLRELALTPNISPGQQHHNKVNRTGFRGGSTPERIES